MPSYNTLDGIVNRLNQSADVKAQLSGQRKVVQFNVDGNAFMLQINEDGSAELKKGIDAAPTVTLTASDEVMEGILAGKVNGVQAFMTGKLKLTGNIMEAQKLVSALDRVR